MLLGALPQIGREPNLLCKRLSLTLAAPPVSLGGGHNPAAMMVRSYALTIDAGWLKRGAKRKLAGPLPRPRLSLTANVEAHSVLENWGENMSAAIRTYSTAKGYVQSAYLIVVSTGRFRASDDTTFILSYHMLLGFAVELYLKAYLTHTGHTEAELRSGGVRHNLKKLLELSEADGFTLPTVTKLVDYLNEQHGSFEYRYMIPDGSYFIRYQADVFAELDELDAYVDGEIGASVSSGLTPSTGGWPVPGDYNGWRIPTEPCDFWRLPLHR